MLAGQPVPLVSSARYLGIVYGPGMPFVACRKQLTASGRNALFGLMGKLRKQRLWAPDIWLRFFDGQVRPILSYGCSIWGVDALDELMRGGPPPRRRDRCTLAERWFEFCLSDPVVKLQIAYMRTMCGAHRPTHRLLFAELPQLLLHFSQHRRCVVSGTG